MSRVTRRYEEWRNRQLWAWHCVLDCGHHVEVIEPADEIECPVCGPKMEAF